MSKVTVLVPAYQSAEYIQDTLDSISAQTHGDFDVIISVDACTDQTYEICRKHSLSDRRFRVFRQREIRLGYVGNCNFLLNQASSEYAMLAFHDDILEPTFIEKLANVLDEKPEVVLSYSDVDFTAVDGAREHWAYTELEGIKSRIKRGWKILIRDGKWWVPNRGLFRLKSAKKVHGLKLHGAGEFSADWPWLFHLSLLGEFARVPETLCYKYRKPDSLSRSWVFSQEQWYEVLSACIRELWISELSTHEKIQLAVPAMDALVKLDEILKKKKQTEFGSNNDNP